MALYRYLKKKPRNKRIKRYVSLVLSLSGLFLIFYVVYPILVFELLQAPKFAQVVKPVPEKDENKVLGEQDKGSLDEEIDYTKVANWFPKKPQEETSLSGETYFLSIPKLRIKDAVVEIAGKSLDKALIHYGGTGLPGDYGKAVIFGHSILPQFYNPENYKSIFSLLPTLEEGDEFFIKFDGIIYRYVIFEMIVTTPDDISVLEQRYDDSYISLITCVPPGTYWKRLVVNARLQQY